MPFRNKLYEETKWVATFPTTSKGSISKSRDRAHTGLCERGCSRKILLAGMCCLWPTGVSFIINSRIVLIYREKVRKIFNGSYTGSHKAPNNGRYIWIERGNSIKMSELLSCVEQREEQTQLEEAGGAEVRCFKNGHCLLSTPRTSIIDQPHKSETLVTPVPWRYPLVPQIRLR